MPEAPGPEPELRMPENRPDQPRLHEEFGPDLDGVQYWTKDLADVADGAFARIHELHESGAQMPRWAVTLQRQFNGMRRQGHAFQKHVIEDSEAIDYGRNLEHKHTSVGSVRDWYRRLGPTNESEDLLYPLLGAVNTLEKSHETIDRNFLIGNILEDAALRTEDPHDKVKLLQEAKHAYKGAEHMGGLHEPESRAALRQRIDCEHLLLAEQIKTGYIGEDEYYRKFEALQRQSAQALAFALDEKNDVHIGDGEALEWASLLYARHRFWSHQNAEQFIVRAALLREDQAIYPWRAEGGQNPVWSFDTVVTDQKSGTVKTRIQLKNGSFTPGGERDRIYLPTVVDVVRSEIPSQQLRKLLLRGSSAIISTYEAMRMSNAELANRIKIDQDAIDTVENLFDKVLA